MLMATAPDMAPDLASRRDTVIGMRNHASSHRNPGHVRRYLEKETHLGTMIGPFESELFSPWNRTKPKRASNDLRVILDVSFPQGESVNSGIPRESLDGSNFKLRLPSPLVLANMIMKKGPRCRLYKIDLSRVYQQLRGDPLDWPMMGSLGQPSSMWIWRCRSASGTGLQLLGKLFELKCCASREAFSCVQVHLWC